MPQFVHVLPHVLKLPRAKIARSLHLVNSSLPGRGSKFATSTFPEQSTQEREPWPRQLGFTGEARVKVTVVYFSLAVVPLTTLL